MVRREPKHLILFLGLGLLLVLAACAPAAPGPESVTDPVPEAEAGPASTSAPVPAGVLSPKDLAAFDFVVEKKIEAVPLAGLTLAIRWGSEPPYVKGYGIANAATSAPATEDTIYQIASLTKQFIAAAIGCVEPFVMGSTLA